MTDLSFVPVGEATGARSAVRLFAFPYAGSGPSSMAELQGELPPAIELWAANLPGRQSRLREAPCTELPQLVNDLADALAPRAREGIALFGYCGGALLAYLVAVRLAERGAAPDHLLVASAAAPDVITPPRRLHLLPSDAFWEQLAAQGGMVPELIGKPELRAVFEPALRADFALLSGYRHVRRSPLPCPITVIYGRSDEFIDRGTCLGWRRHTVHPVALRELPASHWVVEEAAPEVAAMIGEVLCGTADASAKERR